MKPIRIYQVDAFTDQPFRGNPAAVCLMDRDVDDAWLQQVAAEMNLAETAFVWKRDDGFQLRWFTPVTEVDLCGHATLATAFVMFREAGVSDRDELTFQSRSGPLSARWMDGRVWLNFPAQPPSRIEANTLLREAISVDPEWCGSNGSDVLVRVREARAVREVEVDFRKLSTATGRGLIVTAPSDDPEFDFVSRFFAPTVGIDEDPVTGSAHCCLGPYWAEQFGKDTLRAYQASRRGGALDVRVEGERVHLGGDAVIVLVGELRV